MKVRLAVGHYDRTQALLAGEVGAPGLDLETICLPPAEAFWRMLRTEELDAAEMSLANFLMDAAANGGRGRFVALPVFLARGFPHSLVFVGESSGIRDPADLEGARVGLPDFAMTTMVWQRGILAEQFGVRLDAVEWHLGGSEGRGRRGRLDYGLPAWVRCREVPPARSLAAMTAAGELDALLCFDVPDEYRRRAGLRRLWPDTAPVARAYFRRDGVVPLIHVVVLRRHAFERHPPVAAALMEAFVQAKDRAVERLRREGVARPYSLPLVSDLVEEVTELLGPDPWPYGLAANRSGVATLARYLREQGLIDHEPPLDSLFAPVDGEPMTTGEGGG